MKKAILALMSAAIMIGVGSAQAGAAAPSTARPMPSPAKAFPTAKLPAKLGVAGSAEARAAAPRNARTMSSPVKAFRTAKLRAKLALLKGSKRLNNQHLKALGLKPATAQQLATIKRLQASLKRTNKKQVVSPHNVGCTYYTSITSWLLQQQAYYCYYYYSSNYVWEDWYSNIWLYSYSSRSYYYTYYYYYWSYLYYYGQWYYYGAYGLYA